MTSGMSAVPSLNRVTSVLVVPVSGPRLRFTRDPLAVREKFETRGPGDVRSDKVRNAIRNESLSQLCVDHLCHPKSLPRAWTPTPDPLSLASGTPIVPDRPPPCYPGRGVLLSPRWTSSPSRSTGGSTYRWRSRTSCRLPRSFPVSCRLPVPYTQGGMSVNSEGIHPEGVPPLPRKFCVEVGWSLVESSGGG